MSLHFLKRATTHGLVVFVSMGSGVAVVAAEANERQVAPWEVVLILGGFVVLFAGALTLAFVRWLGKVGKNVPRDPSRIEAQLQRLDEKLDSLDRRLARMEGYVSQPVVFSEGRNG